MRILVLVLCISGFLAKDIASLSWELWYLVNQQEISNTKCVNKARPMLHCNGKCYLAKQLKKLEQKQSSPDKKSNPYEHAAKMDWIAPARVNYAFTAIPAAENVPCIAFSFSCPTIYLSAVFHPPANLG